MQGIRFNNIGYKAIPKVACTTIKNRLFEQKNGRAFDSTLDVGNHVHQYWERNPEEIDDCEFRFIVIRDPIKRFLSAYSNRVCHHRELSLEKVRNTNPKIADNFDIYNPGLGQFIDNFEQYYLVNSIEHHSKPITSWLDCGLDDFTNIYRLESINVLQDDLSKLLNKEIFFGRDQTGGRKIPIQDLNRNQVEWLIEFYRDDYDALSGYYSLDDFYSEWRRGI